MNWALIGRHKTLDRPAEFVECQDVATVLDACNGNNVTVTRGKHFIVEIFRKILSFVLMMTVVPENTHHHLTCTFNTMARRQFRNNKYKSHIQQQRRNKDSEEMQRHHKSLSIITGQLIFTRTVSR